MTGSIGHNIHYEKIDNPPTSVLFKMLHGYIPVSGTWKGKNIVSVKWDVPRAAYIVTTEKQEDKEMSYYNTNGDVVEAASTGDVFLFLGGMYYNLTSGQGTEMRGRKTIKRSDGPLKKLSNISNSGDLFKEAITEVTNDIRNSIPF